jgi:hypothetical protein
MAFDFWGWADDAENESGAHCRIEAVACQETVRLIVWVFHCLDMPTHWLQ